MILNKTLASFTFRFLSAYVAGLSIAVFVVLALVYLWLSSGYLDEVHDSVEAELETLEVVYRDTGVEGVEAYLDIRGSPRYMTRFFYLVTDDSRNKLAGNLKSWPETREYDGGWLGFGLEALTGEPASSDDVFIARSTQLPSGEYLMAARPYADVIASAKLGGGALTRSMIVTIVLGTISGAVVASIAVRRIDEINTSLGHILNTDFSARLHKENAAGDYGILTDNLNHMLDQIEGLMVGMREVADNIAHDLRTPLARMRNRLVDLQDKAGDVCQDEINSLIEEADGMLATFNTLLRIGQIESGNRRVEFEALDMKSILFDVVELYEPLASDKSISIRTQLLDVPMCPGDRNMLFQCFANIVDNAIKYTPENGHINIRLLSQDDAIQLDFADDGPGIPEQDRHRVFQRFFRVEASRSKPGNGLGLSLVAAVVKMHKGSFEVGDNRPGLRLTIHLPLDQHAA